MTDPASPQLLTARIGGADALSAGKEIVKNLPAVPLVPSELKRRMGWVQVLFIAYAFTASGPFGVESAVRAGGPLFAIVSLLAVSVMYVIPQILIVSELSAMMPSSQWVQRAFGDFWGFFNANASLFNDFISTAVFPSLFASYFTTIFIPGAPTQWERLGAVLLCIISGTLLSLLSPRTVGFVTTIMSTIVLAPFGVGFVMGAHRIDIYKLLEYRSIYNHGEYNIALLVSTLVWLFSGWRALGALAGDVTKPTDIFFGLGGALALGLATFILPLTVALSLPVVKRAGHAPWSEGYFAASFEELLPNLGKAVALAAMSGMFALFCSALLCYPRILAGAADRGWLPKIFRYRHPKTRAPLPAVLLFTLACMTLSNVHFAILVRIEMMIGAIGYILTAMAVARLRWTEPNAFRPVHFPKSRVMACVVSACPTSVFLVVLFSNLASKDEIQVIIVAVSVIAFVFTMYFVFKRLGIMTCAPLPPLRQNPPKGAVATAAVVVVEEVKAPTAFEAEEARVGAADEDEELVPTTTTTTNCVAEAAAPASPLSLAISS